MLAIFPLQNLEDSSLITCWKCYYLKSIDILTYLFSFLEVFRNFSLSWVLWNFRVICLGILLCFVIESGNPCTLVLEVFLYCFFINVFPTIFSELFLEFLSFRSWISLIDLLIILSFLYHFQTLYLSLLFFFFLEIFLILCSNLSLGFAFRIYFKISKSLLCSLKVVILPSFLPYFFLPSFFLSSFSLYIFNPFIVVLFPVFFPCVLVYFAVVRDFNQMSKNPWLFIHIMNESLKS